MCGNCLDYENRGDAAWLHADDAASPETSTDDHCSARAARNALEATIARAFHMRVLKEVAQLLQNYPTLPLVLTESKVTISHAAPNGGFTMSIETDRGHYVVRLGEWRDEFALASEAVELIEAALRGELRLRIDIGDNGRHCSAERRLPNGEWITLPRHEERGEPATPTGPLHTIFLRCGLGSR